jgi:hypothetical protein
MVDDKFPYSLAKKPTTNQGKLFGVTHGIPIASKAWGQCFIDGPCIFTYDGDAPDTNDHLEPQDGEWTATSGGSFIRSVEIIDSTNKTAIGIIGGGGGGTTSTFLTAILMEDLIANGGPSDAAVYDEINNEPTETIISVYDGCLFSGTFATGTIVYVEQCSDGRNRVRGSTCVVSQSNP